MFSNSKYIGGFLIAISSLSIATTTYAGNPDRAGTASGLQLLINPWAKSSGLANAASASSQGAEAIFTNVAGLAFTKKTEVIFSSSNYLVGSGVKMNAIGFSQKVGETGVFGFSFQSSSFGDLERTTTENPDGGIGTYKPTTSNIAVSYAKAFSNTIYGGITAKFISERTSNVGGSGIALDAGIRYVTGDMENIRIGIAMKNVGPKMNFSGDGLTSFVDQNGSQYTRSEIADGFELPSLITFGFAYDFNFSEEKDMNRLTANGNFTAMSFARDQYAVGLEYMVMKRFAFRAGYQLESKNKSTYFSGTTNALTGLAAGLSFILPLGETNTLSLDYGYKDTNPFAGIHSIGLRLNLE